MLLPQTGMVTAKNASQDFTPTWFIVKQLLKDRCLNWLILLISYQKLTDCLAMLLIDALVP